MLAALAVIAFLLASPPHALLDKADRVAFAVCHRIPSRTFTVAGRPLPLCARCSGSYLAALAGLAVLALRGRILADRLPARPFLLLFGAFLIAWGIDGFNSFLTFFPELPHLYEPRNGLRLLTGAMQGLALVAIMTPLVNRGFRDEGPGIASVSGTGDLTWLLGAGALVVLAVSADWPPLLYPLALVSALAVVAFAALLNVLLLTMVADTGRAGWLRPIAARVTAGTALALIELAALALIHGVLETLTGWPV